LEVFFYEAFEEETQSLKHYLPPYIEAGFTWKTIQEQGDPKPPASLISIRTQSIIPASWATEVSGILSRSTGYDHIELYLKKCKKSLPCGYLPLYCNRAVAEQAALLWMSLLRKLPQQMQNFAGFHRDSLTGQEVEHKSLLVVGVGNIGFEMCPLRRVFLVRMSLFAP
jgi:D-lactate dehydrogenase